MTRFQGLFTCDSWFHQFRVLWLLAPLLPLGPLEAETLEQPVLEWNSFSGATDTDTGNSIAIDRHGNTYVTGYAAASWGSPIRSYTGGGDAYVAKFNAHGVLIWNTFLGSSEYEGGAGIAVDGSGNVYVTGLSRATWGTPVNAHTGGSSGHTSEGFAAKLDASGALIWNTFMGASSFGVNYGSDNGDAIAVDDTGNVYVAGSSQRSWGTPVDAFAGNRAAFVLKLDNNGVRQWNTFMGGGSSDAAYDIAVDEYGDLYVTGNSSATWGVPVNAFGGGQDAFVTKLTNNGAREWHTFIGASDGDSGSAIKTDDNGNVYVAGSSSSSWGAPIEAHSGGSKDAFAAKLDENGVRLWSTFMGGIGSDQGRGLSVDNDGGIYVTGSSTATWGTPENEYAGDVDAFAVKLDSNGERLWNTFLGSSDSDVGSAIVLDGQENLYLAGNSASTWGSPVSAHATGASDTFVVKLRGSDTES